MPAPPLRRDRDRWRDRGAGRRWWRHRRGNCPGHQHKDHQPASHERKGKHPQCKPCAVTCGRAGCPRRIPARRPALAGIGPVVDAGTGDGSRRVRSALGIRANSKATKPDGSPHAGFGQVQPERSKFDALTKSPCHTQASVPRVRASPEELTARRSGGSHAWSHKRQGTFHQQANRASAETATPPHQHRALASTHGRRGILTPRNLAARCEGSAQFWCEK